MKELIANLNEYKASIIGAIKTKYKEINSGEELIIDEENNLSKYAEYIENYLIPEFEGYFTEIGYKGIPEELLLTVQGQVKYKETGKTDDLQYALFGGATFTGNLSSNKRCILLFTNSLYGSRMFNVLRSLQEIYVLTDTNASELTSVENLKESIINPYWFFRGTTKIVHIYGILDMRNVGYTVGSTGDYFFSNMLKDGSVAKVAEVPYLKTLYMKNIHRAYNFGNSPLSMDSVLYCIRNAKRDEDYAINEKTEEAEGTYKFTLMGSEYAPEQIDEIQQELATKVAEGVNMEILFSGN